MVKMMVTEERIKYAMDLIAEKKWDAQTLMYDMQNSSTTKHDNADLHEWLANMTDYGYDTLIERLKRL
jgi:hypothetical protein